MERPQYGVFKGLQRPVEFRGLKGRFKKMFIIIVACSIGICFIGTPLFGTYVSIALGVIGGIASFFVPAALQREMGLYDKKKLYGNYIIHRIISNN